MNEFIIRKGYRSLNNSDITGSLSIYKSGSTVVNIEGYNGQLFSVTDSLSGSLMSVNDISGLPILEVFSDDKVIAGKFGSNALVVTGSNVGIGTDIPKYKLDIYGSMNISGSLYVSGSIIGGTANKIKSIYSTIGGGIGNITTGSYSTIGGGSQNRTTGSYSVIGGGNVNKTVGSFSSVLGGNINTSEGALSTVLGGQLTVSKLWGEVAHASCAFTSSGDAQHVILTAINETNDATPTNLFLDGVSTRITIETNSILYGTANVAGIKTDGSAGAHYIRKFSIKNIVGTTSLLGSVSTVGTDVESSGGYDITITADDSNDALDIKVTGASSEVIKWVAVIDAIRIKI